MSDPEGLDCTAVWCDGKEWCPITCTADLIDRKWHPVIIHRLLQNGPLGFNALEDEANGISSTVLSSSLDDLEDKELVDRTIVSEKPVRIEYSLTKHGESLEPVIEAMKEWGQTHLALAESSEQVSD